MNTTYELQNKSEQEQQLQQSVAKLEQDFDQVKRI